MRKHLQGLIKLPLLLSAETSNAWVGLGGRGDEIVG
jgi:hypothetical protein